MRGVGVCWYVHSTTTISPGVNCVECPINSVDLWAAQRSNPFWAIVQRISGDLILQKNKRNWSPYQAIALTPRLHPVSGVQWLCDEDWRVPRGFQTFSSQGIPHNLG
ncbi:hypothetical protein BDN67DRAFT_971764 [Paxillus ammoniavirescens]|nr:hypothetical protein BDN67DRAFT_971764 [Paxillus ammoniavirescens]